jgi:hypothetical protein
MSQITKFFISSSSQFAKMSNNQAQQGWRMEFIQNSDGKIYEMWVEEERPKKMEVKWDDKKKIWIVTNRIEDQCKQKEQQVIPDEHISLKETENSWDIDDGTVDDCPYIAPTSPGPYAVEPYIPTSPEWTPTSPVWETHLYEEVITNDGSFYC